MTSANVGAKQLALKFFLLNQAQREAIEAQITELPLEVRTYLDELTENFSSLHELSQSQQKSICADLLGTVNHSGWDLLKERMLNFDQLKNQSPSKLHAIISELRG